MPLEILTSFSPNPARVERQRACLASWLSLGCHVVAVQGPEDILDLGTQGIDVEIIERPSSPPLLSEIWAVAESRRGFVLLLNSDLEIGPDDGLPSVYTDVFQASWQSIAESIGTGLLAIRRWNYARGTDRRKATPERWGIDGFYFRADDLRPFDGKPFAIGRPVWDWWLPLSYGRAKRAVFEVRHQVLFHERHPQLWSDLQWEAAMRCAVEPRHAAKAQNSRFLRGYGEQLTEELRRTLRPLPERSPV